MTTDALPPHDEAAEWALVACGIAKPEILPEIDPSEFYLEATKGVLRMALALFRDKTPDVGITLGLELLRSHRELYDALTKAQDSLPSPEGWPSYRDKVGEMAYQRDALRLAAEIREAADAGILDASALVDKAAKLRGRAPGGRVLNGRQVGLRLTSELERRAALQGRRSGLETGYYGFDALTDGLQAGEQCIIAARPSVGKTALACNIVEQVCLRAGHRTLFVTLEMSPAAIGRRLLSGFCRIPMSALKTGVMSEHDMAKCVDFAGILRRSQLVMMDAKSGMDIGRIAAEIRRCHREDPIKLVVLDYLQKVQPSNRHEKRTYEVGEVSGVLYALANETGAAFLTLAQINREPEKDKGRLPRLSDLADSAQIERDGDCIALLHRDKDDKRKATLTVGKQRDGETGTIPLTFLGEFCRFENGSPVEPDEPQNRRP